jgi:hypothetical protein
MHKRKHRKSNRDDDREQSAHAIATSHVQSTFSTESLDAPTQPDPCLYIQAHEADVIRGPPAMSARLLECQDPPIAVTAGTNSRSGLIRWGSLERSGDADTVDTQQSNQPALWVDR